MRKLMFAIMALVGFTLTSSAQQAPKKADKAAKETKAPAAKKEEAKAPLKKDGTPDKRFKKKEEAKTPLKKDGTPDKRYKENKK
ncbi:hypothetical protein [Flavobacterium sp.]|uniref:hypothetical protein n=1 Tax=Flavobacterium sp. TaxID=239 RepID=UPI0025E4D0D5|nr:hypothetical protein [Flavobacterium sp.]